MKIPLIQPPYQGLGDFLPEAASQSLIDGYLEAIEGQTWLFRRPGLFKWSDLSKTKGCLGFHYWVAKDTFILAFPDAIYANGSANPNTWVEISSMYVKPDPLTPCVFAESPNWIYIVNGGEHPMVWDGTLTTGSLVFDVDPTTPTFATSVVNFDGYFLMNSPNTRNWYYTTAASLSVITKPVWNAVGSAADSSPNPLMALAVGWRELQLIGKTTTEVWYNSGAAAPNPPFSRTEGAAIEQGTESPYTVVMIDNTFFWLNQFHQVIRLEGRTPKVISTPIDRILKSYSNVSDARAFSFDRFYIITFPTQAITWVYDTLLNCWYQWGEWMEDQGVYRDWLVNGGMWVKEYSSFFGSSKIDGRIFIVHSSACTDDTKTLRCFFKTADFDGGTYQLKSSEETIFKIVKGSPEELTIPDATRCELFEYQFPDTGSQGTWSVSGLASGLVFSADTRTVVGSPIVSGDFSLMVFVPQASGVVLGKIVNHHIVDVAPLIHLPGE